MISRIYSGSILALAIATSLATSLPTSRRAFNVGLYQVKSDCPNAQTEGRMTINFHTDSPTGREEQYMLSNGTLFGFPSNTLISGRVRDSDKGEETTSSDDARECRAILWETGADSGLFACYRGEELECTIHLQKI